MSQFSYISFPRQADTSCIKSKFDKSKSFTVAQIRGTELEKQFDGNLDDLPDDLNVYLGDFFTDFQGIHVYDNNDATFENIFDNSFIYSFQGVFELLDAERYINDCMGTANDGSTDDEAMTVEEEENLRFLQRMIKSNREDVEMCRRQLYELVKTNTHPGETIEIYSEVVNHIDYNLGPANEILKLNVDQVLTSELLRTDDRLKIEILNND